MRERDEPDQSQIARPGDVWRLVVKPPACYAGSPGSRAVVAEVSETSIYVVFESGLRDSFPPGRFATFFVPAEIVDARADLRSTRAA